MSNTITGTIVKVLPRESGQSNQGKSWQKQIYILQTNDQYPRTIAFSLWGDKVNQYSCSQGESVTVHITIESREFKERWYTEVQGWRVERIGFNPNLNNPLGSAQAMPAQSTVASSSDLPF